jgi:hypothetical protein
MPEAGGTERLLTALAWMLMAFVGHPEDVRIWPKPEALTRHPPALARFGEAVDLQAPRPIQNGSLQAPF